MQDEVGSNISAGGHSNEAEQIQGAPPRGNVGKHN